MYLGKIFKIQWAITMQPPRRATCIKRSFINVPIGKMKFEARESPDKNIKMERL